MNQLSNCDFIQKLFNTSITLDVSAKHAEVTPQHTYLITLEQPDGTTQVVHLTEQQTEDLGIKFTNEEDDIEIENKPTNIEKKSPALTKQNIPKKTIFSIEKPLGSSENPIEIIRDGNVLQSTQNLSQNELQKIADALKSEETGKQPQTEKNFVYRVVYPEELDLKPVALKQAKRGRPKKRPYEDLPPVEIKLEQEPVVKNARTRSGRITRPPRHIEEVFKKIETSENDDVEEDLQTSEFVALTTNQNSDTKEPVLTGLLEYHQRRRNIAAQYRCPKCKKAYLGRSRMIKHLQQNPGHGPIPEHCKPKEEDETWNYLIDISQKRILGQKGRKFCTELSNLLRNAQILAHFLFKPVSSDKTSFYVDDLLSRALAIEPGNYSLSENELCKDVSIFTLLENGHFYDSLAENNSNKDTANANITFKKECVELESASEVLDRNYQRESTQSYNFANAEDNQSLNSTLEGQNLYDGEGNDHNFRNLDSLGASDINFIDSHNSNSVKTCEMLSENSLLNLHPSVDELILHSVDTGQVANLLDSSTNSDDVMNVDHLVNERLRNLTDSDLELPNPSLNLDLQSLDLFQFHNS